MSRGPRILSLLRRSLARAFAGVAVASLLALYVHASGGCTGSSTCTCSDAEYCTVTCTDDDKNKCSCDSECAPLAEACKSEPPSCECLMKAQVDFDLYASHYTCSHDATGYRVNEDLCER